MCPADKLVAAGSANKTWFNSYHSYADHLQFLSDLQASAPANTEIVTAGKSLNGNSITGIHIFGSAGKSKKPAVVFHGTVHAREWIGTMVGGFAARTDTRVLAQLVLSANNPGSSRR